MHGDLNAYATYLRFHYERFLVMIVSFDGDAVFRYRKPANWPVGIERLPPRWNFLKVFMQVIVLTRPESRPKSTEWMCWEIRSPNMRGASRSNLAGRIQAVPAFLVTSRVFTDYNIAYSDVDETPGG